jgi:hypothetical protein
MFLVPTRVVPDERDDASVAAAVLQVQARIGTDLVDHLGDLVVPAQKLRFDDQLHRWDVQVGSGLFLTDRWKVLLVFEIGEDGSQH